MLKNLIILLALALTPLVPRSAITSELECLVTNVYYEARGEPFQGKVAVALVTLNRADSPDYPSGICRVVFQKNQFSWTKNYNTNKVNSAQWQESREAALHALLNRDHDFRATHFHNVKVNPRWKLKRVARIANHYFYLKL